MNNIAELSKEVAECRIKLHAAEAYNIHGRPLDELIVIETTRQEMLTRLEVAYARLNRLREEAVKAALSEA